MYNGKFNTGLCNYCAIICCKKCIELGSPCHKTDNGRTVYISGRSIFFNFRCSLHAKKYRLAEVDANRIVVSTGSLGAAHQIQYNKFITSTAAAFPIFLPYYADFNVRIY